MFVMFNFVLNILKWAVVKCPALWGEIPELLSNSTDTVPPGGGLLNLFLNTVLKYEAVKLSLIVKCDMIVNTFDMNPP